MANYPELFEEALTAIEEEEEEWATILENVGHAEFMLNVTHQEYVMIVGAKQT